MITWKTTHRRNDSIGSEYTWKHQKVKSRPHQKPSPRPGPAGCGRFAIAWMVDSMLHWRRRPRDYALFEGGGTRPIK